MALGRGLASLIPKRRTEELDEATEGISSMETVDENVEQTPVAEQEEAKPVGIPIFEEPDDDVPQAVETESAPVEAVQEEAKEVTNTFDDFGQLEEDGEEMPMPDKPFVTPLELDDVEDADLIAAAKSAAQHKQSVHQSRTQFTTPKPTVSEEKAEVQEEEVDEVEKILAEEPVVSKTETKVEEKESKPEPTPVAKERTEEAKTEPAVKVKEKVAEKVEEVGEKWDRHEDQVQQIPIGDISINPFQPRRHFDEAELTELKDSIDQHGILQPLVVSRLSNGKYELIAGERRLRASKELKWTKVPCVVRRDVAGNQSRLVYALIENIQRENLNPIELALAYQQLHDEYGLNHEEIGQRMGKARVSVTNALRVLQLPAEVQRGLMDGKISSGHARAILMIPDEEKQIRFYKHLLDEGLTVRKAETRARRIQRTMGVHDPQRNRRRNRHPLAQKYGSELEGRYGTDVNVRFSDEKNRFEVVLKAYSAEDFELLVGRLLGNKELPTPPEDLVEEDEE